MKPTHVLILSALIAGGWRDGLVALESEPLARPGVRNVQLVTDVPAIVPGRPFTVGLRLAPMPGHHTYWRGPGIVGVATRIDWNLPAGFSAGPILWPPPSRVLMAGIVAHGFKEPVLLLTEITPPANLTAKEIALSARVSWMACAVSCNPGLADLSLTVPVGEAGSAAPVDKALAEAFAAAREAAPKPAPDSWRFEARLAAPDRIDLVATIPGLTDAQVKSVHFYCDDMQVDSDEPQIIEVLDANTPRFRISLARPEFAPKHPTSLSGVLHCPGGWPGTGSAYVEISAPWPEGTFPNEN
jgi:DsbC/DsbD-like thiol-disulfide interchange protein